MRSVAPLLAVTALACRGGGGASGGGGGGGFEAALAADLSRTLGVEVAAVRCPPGPPPVTCTVTQAAGGEVPVALEDAADGTAWALDGVVIETAPLAVDVTAALAEVGLTATVDCGPPVRIATVGDRVACRFPTAAGGGAE